MDFQFETDNDKGCRIAGVSVTVGLNILFAVIGWFFEKTGSHGMETDIKF